MSERLKLLEKYKLEDELYAKVFESFSLEKYQDLYSKIKSQLKHLSQKEFESLVNKKVGNYIFMDILEQDENTCTFVAKKHSKSNHNLVHIKLERINTKSISLETVIEQNLLKRFEDTNIVNLIDSGIFYDYSCRYSILEFTEGTSLASLEKEEFVEFSSELAIAFVIEFLKKLRKVHSIFRTPFNVLLSGHDLRENIHLTHEGQIKLCHLEIPYYQPEEHYRTDVISNLENQKSPLSFAPEMVRNEFYSIHSDQFKVGLFLWETLSKKSFFNPSASLKDQLEQYVYRPIENVDTQLISKVDKVLQVVFHPNPDKRFEHCDEFAIQLSQLLQEENTNMLVKNFLEKKMADHKLEWILKSMYYQEVGSEGAHLDVEVLSDIRVISFLMEDNSDTSWQLV